MRTPELAPTAILEAAPRDCGAGRASLADDDLRDLQTT
jgi:hypothetical protein